MVNQKTKRPYNKVEVIREYGFPVLSKEIAGKIYTLQHPTEKNATVRHAIMTGETGAYGGYREGHPHENGPKVAGDLRRPGKRAGGHGL